MFYYFDYLAVAVIVVLGKKNMENKIVSKEKLRMWRWGKKKLRKLIAYQ